MLWRVCVCVCVCVCACQAAELDDQAKAAHRAWELERALSQSRVLELGSRGSSFGLSDEEHAELMASLSGGAEEEAASSQVGSSSRLIAGPGSRSSSAGSFFLTEAEAEPPHCNRTVVALLTPTPTRQISEVWGKYDLEEQGVPKEKLGGIIEECLFLTAHSVKQLKPYPPGADPGDLSDDMKEMQGETKRLLLHLVRANKDGHVSKKEFMQRWNEYGERLYTAKTCTIL
jgi:hypothetical protein